MGSCWPGVVRLVSNVSLIIRELGLSRGFVNGDCTILYTFFFPLDKCEIILKLIKKCIRDTRSDSCNRFTDYA